MRENKKEKKGKGKLPSSQLGRTVMGSQVNVLLWGYLQCSRWQG